MTTLPYDEIHVEDLEVFARHGVFPEENRLGQKFVISLVLYVDTRPAGIADCLEKSVHYGEVSAFLTDYMHDHTFQLHHRALHALIGGQIQRLTDAGLARGRQQHGIAHVAQTLQVMDDGEIVLVVLAEAHTRVKDDLVVGDAGFLGDRKAAAHILAEFIEEIVVFRLLAVVHQAAGDLILRDEVRHLAVVLETPDVVDEVSARLERLRHHRAFVAVDGNRDVEFLLDHLDDGNDAVDLLLHADLHMCLFCAAEPECNWSREKKNMTIRA